jgi:alpha,alpha-trehalase
MNGLLRSRNGRAWAVAFLSCLLLPAASPAQVVSDASSLIRVEVASTIRQLIDEEDTDGDQKITIDDRHAGGRRGDKVFWVVDTWDRRYEVAGTYRLSNLLQELTLEQEAGRDTAELDPARIFENPVHGLTRRIDEENLVALMTDTKTATLDGFRYIYVPRNDEDSYEYLAGIADRHPDLRIRVVRLPEVVTAEWVLSRNGRHGLLSLALARSSDGRWEGKPYVVPGGRFNEMYGWDSYFEALGLLVDGRTDLARAMVDNFVYEIDYYGKILNANRSYYLTRSQPPFLTSMVLAVFRHLPDDSASAAWLRGVIRAAIKEYREVWMGEARLTKIGLSRYYGAGIGPPPEVEPGHFDAVYSPYAERSGMTTGAFEEAYKSGTVEVPELDAFFVHDRCMRESGHDRTFRWDDRCADFATVDLNSLLYKIELDIARTIEGEFADSLELDDGSVERSTAWYRRAERRRELMNEYLWDPERGLFLDYDLVNERRKAYTSAVAFYPLWAGLATPEQAESIVRNAVPALEEAGGIVASTEDSRGSLSPDRPARQWDHPNGWAPHQMLAWRGLLNYGLDDIAHRLVYRWLYTITRNAADHNGTVPEKYDVAARTHRVFAEYGNVGTEFAYITKEGFGWMNASYEVGLTLLPPDLRQDLEQLIPPEWLFLR